MKRILIVVAIAVAIIAIGLIVVERNMLTQSASRNGMVERHPPAEVTTSQLKIYQSPPVTDPNLATFVDRNAKVDRTGPDFAARFPKISDPKDIAAVVSVMKDPEDDDTVRHEAIELLRRSKYAQLDDDLIALFKSPAEKERFRSWIVQHIGVNALVGDAVAKSRLTQVLGQALDDPQVKVRCEALFALSNLGDFKVTPTVTAWLNPTKTEPPPIRAIAIRCAKSQNKRDLIPTIRTFARDPDEVVRIAALVALSEWGDQESRSACEKASKAPSKRLQTCGRMAVERLDKAAKAGAAPTAATAPAP